MRTLTQKNHMKSRTGRYISNGVGTFWFGMSEASAISEAQKQGDSPILGHSCQAEVCEDRTLQHIQAAVLDENTKCLAERMPHDVLHKDLEKLGCHNLRAER